MSNRSRATSSALMIAMVVILWSYSRAFDLAISWEPSTDDDLAGYNVSYDSPTSDRWATQCDPYEVSSLGVEYNTTYTITDAGVGQYAVYIRAYDTTGNMSDYEPYAFLIESDGEGGYTVTTEGISEPADCLPEALISVSTTTGNVPVEVSFDGSGTNNPTSYSWDFDNDGTSDSDLQNSIYTYTTEGVYFARLRVTNSLWFSDAFATIYATLIPYSPTVSNAIISNGSIQ